MSERIAVSKLMPGMVILKITEQHGPVKIKKSGLVTSQDMIRGLSEMGVSEVEIDPAQTVELEVDDAPNNAVESQAQTQSQTQALLKGQYDRQGHYDNQLADQFNRNLFLPSVQGIPAVWWVYLRQTLVATLTVFFGLSIGFGSATYRLWFADEPDSQTQVAANESVQDTAPMETITQPVEKIDDHNGSTNSTNEQVIAQLGGNGETDDLTADAAEEEGIPLTGPQDSDTTNVSPELLRRFNQAIDDLDREQADPNARVREPVRPADDIQRIDQLPVRLMTTLPTMTFSAHMYASRPRDRWVRVNGLRLQEGDYIADQVRIINIEAQRVVLEYRGEIFTMAALTDW